MNYPSVKRISECLSVEKAIAKQIRGIMDGSIDPLTVGTKASQYAKHCFRDPDFDTLKLWAIDELYETCGVESISSVYGTAEYCNAGDLYACTVFYFPSDGRFRIGCYADYAV